MRTVRCMASSLTECDGPDSMSWERGVVSSRRCRGLNLRKTARCNLTCATGTTPIDCGDRPSRRFNLRMGASYAPRNGLRIDPQAAFLADAESPAVFASATMRAANASNNSCAVSREKN